MKHIRKAQIVIEKQRILAVSRHRSVAKRCEICCCEIEMVSPQKAAAIASVGQRTIFRRIEDGSLHLAETEDGTFLICTASLASTFAAE